jgi:hypothetical protein
MPKGDDVVHVEAKPWSSLAQDRPLTWEPVWTALMKDPDSARITWRRIGYVFDLPDPRLMTELSSLDGEERAVMPGSCSRRAIWRLRPFCLRKTRSPSASPTTAVSEEIDKRLSDRDVTVGFMVMFRQCYANDEKASFAKARNIAMKHTKIDSGEQRAITIRAWAKAHGQLRGRLLESHVNRAVAERGLGPQELLSPRGDPQHPERTGTPEMLLSTHWYGDMIHWTGSQSTFAEWEGDAFGSAWNIIHTLMAAGDLAHFYVGFGGLVARLLGEPAEALKPG